MTTLFGLLEHPVIQAPMAGAQAGAMAAAVSATGALGSLPCAVLTAETMRKEIELVRARTDRPLNVNFFVHQPPKEDPAREAAWRALLKPYYEEYGIDPAGIPAGGGRAPFSDDFADALEPFKPEIVSFHFGLPSPKQMARVKGWGSKVLSSATTVAEAQWLEANGVDAVIAQGIEAGGHRGIFLSEDLTTQVGTFALLPQVVAAVKVPVIAAGGIADAAGVRAALALGATAAQVGTAFLICDEAITSPVYRSALKSPEARHTALTNLFTGRPARGIVNRLMRELGPMNPAAPAFPLAGTALVPLRDKALARGLPDFTQLWCGQNPTGCREVPAARIVESLLA
jgi:nitronate monooxygenase